MVINVKTGAIEAMYGNPTYDPIPLVSPNVNVEKYAWTASYDPGAGRARSCPAPSSTASYPGRPSRWSPRPPSTTTSRRWPSGLPGDQLHLAGPSRTSRSATSRIDGVHEHCGGMLTRDPAGVVRHRVRHAGHGARGPALTARGRGLRVQPGPADRPTGRRRVQPSPSPAQIDQRPKQQAVPGLLGLRPAGRRSATAPADGAGGRRHRRSGRDHDAPRHEDIHDSSGNLLTTLPAQAVADRHRAR